MRVCLTKLPSMRRARWQVIALAALCGATVAAGAENEKKPKLDRELPDPSFDISPEEAAANQHYQQRDRPQFHYTPMQGFIGDATGLIYDAGTYHLFYMSDQWERRKNRHKRWGYATSRDLLSWHEQSSVLDPVMDHQPGSGSGIVDYDNTLRLAHGNERTLVVFYTDYLTGTCILYSTDAGKTWTRHPRNPVLPRIGSNDRDPTVFWYEPAKEWRMVRHAEPFHGTPAGRTGFAFFRSANLLEWTPLSEIGDFNECPDLFELSVEGGPPGEKKWVLMDAGFNYKLGRFDGTQFIPESEKLRADYGASKHVYAPQTWKSRDGWTPPIQMGFLTYPKGAAEMPVLLTWHGQMTFPCELRLRQFPEGARVCRQPIDAIRALYARTESRSDFPLGAAENPLRDVQGDTLDLQLDLELGVAAVVELVLRGQTIRYSVATQRLEWGAIRATLPLIDRRLRLRALVDRASIEIFADDGRASMSGAVFFDPKITSYSLAVPSGDASVRSLTVHHVNSLFAK